MQKFDVNKYLGVWYELVHYPSWFQRNYNYNTKAEYSLDRNTGNIIVKNSTISNGKYFEVVGTAKYLGGVNFRVDFPIPEIDSIQQSPEFQQYQQGLDPNVPNYVIDSIWKNQRGEYSFAVVTDAYRNTLYVLSRSPSPSLSAYNQLMSHVTSRYDRDRLVQTPHYS